MLFNPREEQQRQLFEKLCHTVLNHSTTDVAGAAVNLLLTVVQRRHIKCNDALVHWDELMGRGRVALQRRYSQRQSVQDEYELSQRLT